MVYETGMSTEAVQLIQNLVVASGMVAVTVLIHFWGLIFLTYLMRRGGKRLLPHKSHMRQAALILLVVFGIFGLHTIDIWLYASLYLLLGEMHSLERALYFSTVTFASLGFGDIVFSPLAAGQCDRGRQRRHLVRLVDHISSGRQHPIAPSGA